jgi:hypothetical protein
MIASAKAGFAGRSQGAGGFGNSFQGSHYDRVGEGRLCRP